MKTKCRVPLTIVMCLCVILFLIPFYMMVINSFKENSELLTDVVSWPKKLTLDNYRHALERLDYLKIFANSLFVTIMSNIGVTIISAMAAYRIERYPSEISNKLKVILLVGLIIPFQVVMIPMVKVLQFAHLINSLWGVVLVYWGLGLPFTIFLFRGFVSGIPRDIEEAAIIDGCSLLRMFWSIIIPLLKPIIFTGVTINTFWFWNDFLLPQLILSEREKQTIPIAVNAFFGQYVMKWDLALPTLVMAVIPAILLFLVFQRYIVEGITAGAIKG